MIIIRTRSQRLSQKTPASSRISQIRAFPVFTQTDVRRVHPLPLDRLTSILISRFLFDLQAAKQKSTGMASSTGSRVESAVFERVIGSLSEILEFGGADVDNREEDAFGTEHGNMEQLSARARAGAGNKFPPAQYYSDVHQQRPRH